MYVCPHCHEEIPDKVRQTKDECPFCHEFWPPQEPAPEATAPAENGAPDQAGLQGGGGQAAQPAVDTSADFEIHEPEPKSKLGLIIGIIAAVVVIGGGAGAYFFLFRGKAAKEGKSITIEVGKQKVTLKKLYDVDYEKMVKWHNNVRKTVLKYLADRCDAYRQNGFKLSSHLVTREKLVTATEKEKRLELEIKPIKGKETPLESFNWFRCPGILAFVHKEHEMVFNFSFSIKERVIKSDIKRAVLKIKGGRFVRDKGTFNVYWDTGRAGLSFPGLKKHIKDKPGLKALYRNKISRPKDGVFSLAGIKFKRLKTGRHRSKSFLVGQWEGRASTDTFKDLLQSWAGGCRGLKRKIRKINKSIEPEQFKIPLLKQKAVDVGIQICKAISKIAKSVEPWDAAAVKQGRVQLQNALVKAQTTLRKPLLDAAKILKSDIKPHFWCGDPNGKGTPCKTGSK